MNHYTPVEYLKIDIANQMGRDKDTFPQRIAWVNRIKNLRSKVSQAEKPPQFLAGVLALEDALAGRPSGHAVGLDACASGITILGILCGCPITSANVGIIGKRRMDMYGQCTKAMNGLLTNDVEASRKEVKDAQMPHFYGSKARPREVFGEDTYELAAFYEAQETVAPGACYVMRELLGSWQPFALEHSHTLPDNFHARVPVLQKMESKVEVDELAHATLTYVYDDNVGMESGVAVAANMTHAVDGFLVRETVRRCYYDEEKLVEVQRILMDNRGNLQAPNTRIGMHPMERASRDHQFLSLRGVEFITEESVLNFSNEYRGELLALICETLQRPSFPVLTVHDEFKCHPNYCNYMREVYRDILAELADSRAGERIIQEVRGDDTFRLQKFDPNLGDKIMDGEYWLS